MAELYYVWVNHFITSCGNRIEAILAPQSFAALLHPGWTRHKNKINDDLKTTKKKVSWETCKDVTSNIEQLGLAAIQQTHSCVCSQARPWWTQRCILGAPEQKQPRSPDMRGCGEGGRRPLQLFPGADGQGAGPTIIFAMYFIHFDWRFFFFFFLQLLPWSTSTSNISPLWD